MEKKIEEILNLNYKEIRITKSKIKLRKILIKSEICFQVEEIKDNKAYHNNFNLKQAVDFLLKNLKENRQLSVLCDGFDLIVSIKNANLIIKKNKSLKRDISLKHDSVKAYILKEGIICPPLVKLGVQTEDGYIIKKHYDKYVQINKFLEVFKDILDKLNLSKVRVIDLCCGKSYLSFYIYYYLTEILKKEIKMIGVDLKQDVIDKCTSIARELDYDIEFYSKNINDFKFDADIVISLHACDKATDIAIKNAVKNKAKAILAVPCCHQEANSTLDNQNLDFMLRHGIIKERFSSLFTDSVRAMYLENNGYKTDIFEFVDFDSSPKNLMIRAIYTGNFKHYNIFNILKEYSVDLEINR